LVFQTFFEILRLVNSGKMDPPAMLIEQFIRPTTQAPFEIQLQAMHDQDLSFYNINLSAYYTAFFLSMTSLMEYGEIGKKFGVSNVLLKILGSKTLDSEGNPHIFWNFRFLLLQNHDILDTSNSKYQIISI